MNNLIKGLLLTVGGILVIDGVAKLYRNRQTKKYMSLKEIEEFLKVIGGELKKIDEKAFNEMLDHYEFKFVEKP